MPRLAPVTNATLPEMSLRSMHSSSSGRSRRYPRRRRTAGLQTQQTQTSSFAGHQGPRESAFSPEGACYQIPGQRPGLKAHDEETRKP